MGKVSEDIKEYGWHVIKVLEDESGPGFGYSIGLFETFRHPEVAIIGLTPELTHDLINIIGELVRENKPLISSTFRSEILDNFDCYIIDVDENYYDEYFGQAINYYGNKQFPVMQCIYPTVKGIYPWQSEWPVEIKDIQPILGTAKTV